MATFKGAAREAQRAALLMKQREKERQELELQKKKLEAEMRVGEMSTKFAVHYDAIEHQLKTNTVSPTSVANTYELTEKTEEQLEPEELTPVADEDVAKTESENHAKRRRLGKNPTVDTSFLPDIDRDEEEKRLREELRREWVAKQAAIKEEEILITYSYWDGSGHRKQVRMKKGHSVHLFLHRCLEQLRKDFSELKSASADQMMYIKEDLIIPHHYTFYDFIVTKARGKSGPLFCFDVHDDVRLRMDANVEKEESHAGKVCLRSWYERNKHIFPASRWEPYDPAKNWDQYTISDKMSAKITIK
ncbi:unnamed protein product [Heterobilharzia americana]|nr:unnamed protein product [Heterobilharzia americana]